ncbi:predicted protein, partial [Nematostella vectensis]
MFSKCSKIQTLDLSDGRWHHVCITWGSHEGRWSFHVDGARRGQGSKLMPGYTFPSTGKLVLGQEGRVLSGSADPSVAFVGALSQFTMWNESLTDETVKKIASRCAENLGSLVDWKE